MEFNRLFSQAISVYGEGSKTKKISKSKESNISKINIKLYKSILDEKDLEKLIDNLNKKQLFSS